MFLEKENKKERKIFLNFFEKLLTNAKVYGIIYMNLNERSFSEWDLLMVKKKL